jgi:NAD-dependent SIR2 family protein deacetylase
MDYINPIISTENYKEFCKTNGFMTKHKRPQPQKKAETLYRYLTNNIDFVEEHTGLEDSLIELEILLTALAMLE